VEDLREEASRGLSDAERPHENGRTHDETHRHGRARGGPARHTAAAETASSCVGQKGFWDTAMPWMAGERLLQGRGIALDIH